MVKYYNTFIVRIGDGEPQAPRGHIVHVPTQEQEYFNDYAKLNKFIAEHLISPENGNDAEGVKE